MRDAHIKRKTAETEINLAINLDRREPIQIDTGIGFLDHMLHLFAFHAQVSLTVSAKGDLHIDPHHTTEDVGICLGQAINEALGDKKGIKRYGACVMPMDEALIQIALDLSNRAHLTFECPLPNSHVGTFDTELIEEFWGAVAQNSRSTTHIHYIAGKNTHHIIEAVFKGFGQAFREAIHIQDDRIPSSKGTL